MPGNQELAASIEHINRLVERVENLADPSVQAEMQELVQCLLEYHGAAVRRLVAILQEGTAGRSVIEALADDELVGSLLLLYDCHPQDFEERVARALSSVRPFLASHGGDVELAALDDGVVHLRLTGNCHGCPSSTATLRTRIEQAIYDAAPETVRIEVEDHSAAGAPASGFVPLQQLASRQETVVRQFP